MRKESKDKKGDFIEEKNLQRLRVPRAHTCTAAYKCGHFQQGGVESNRRGGNDRRGRYYAAEWSELSEGTEFVLSCERVHHFFHLAVERKVMGGK